MMAKNGQRLGELLMEADVITKRQLAKAIQKQVQGDDRKLGDILIDMGIITVADLTDAMLNTHHEEPVIEEKVVAQPIDISQDAVLKTKFALDVKTIIAAATGIASLVGMWYMLQADIQEAKELPSLETLYSNEYPSRPEGYNWPRSYEQYKDNVEGLQDEMDEAYEKLDEFEEAIDDLEKIISNFIAKIFFTLTYVVFGTTVLNVLYNESFWLIDNGNGGFVGTTIKENIFYFSPLIENQYVIYILISLTVIFFVLSLGVKLNEIKKILLLYQNL